MTIIIFTVGFVLKQWTFQVRHPQIDIDLKNNILVLFFTNYMDTLYHNRCKLGFNLFIRQMLALYY